MLPMKRVAFFFLLTTLCVGCSNFKRQQMYIQLNNQSGVTLRNIEIDYPGGVYGMSALENDHTNRKLQAIGESSAAMPTGTVGKTCKFTLKFEDNRRAQVSKDWDFGTNCPQEVSLTIGQDFSVSGKVLR